MLKLDAHAVFGIMKKVYIHVNNLALAFNIFLIPLSCLNLMWARNLKYEYFSLPSQMTCYDKKAICSHEFHVGGSCSKNPQPKTTTEVPAFYLKLTSLPEFVVR